MRFFRRGVLSKWQNRAGVAALTAGLLLSGCAYFNTFYHARKFYNEAETKRKEAEEEGRPSSDAASLYEKSIKKCAKIIVEHSESKWVDDALLMMGNGFFYSEQYTRALRKYEELTTYYPDSPFVNEARWMSGLAHLELDQAEEAREIFRGIADGRQDSERKPMAAVMLARSWEADGKYQHCIDEISGLIGDEQETDANASAYLVLGDCYRASGDLPAAIDAYQQAAALARDQVERFEAQLRMAGGLQDSGQIGETYRLYEEMMGRENQPIRQARLRLAMGRLLVERGEVEEGIKMFQQVVDDALVQDLPGEAQFEIALAYEKGHRDLEKALEAYDLVSQKRPPRDISDRATGRKENVRKLNEFLEKREEASPDSVPLLDFIIAEHYLFASEEPEVALGYYESVVENGSNETLAAKSLLAVAWIREWVEEDSLGAMSFYQDVVDKYPETEYADVGREILGLPPRPKPEPADTLNVLSPDVSVAVDSLATELRAPSAADSIGVTEIPGVSERGLKVGDLPDFPATIAPEPAAESDSATGKVFPDTADTDVPVDEQREISPPVPPLEEDDAVAPPDSL